MCNEFVSYLNSMNNANGDNINALAESQVTNKFYNSIRVERKLGKYILDKLKNGENHCFIITGHAGDGKTSILVQVLRELNMLEFNEKLKDYDRKSLEGINLTYVKDMSELKEELQIELLLKSLEAPKRNESSILISNTGPLINSFKKALGDNNEELMDDIENKLLKQLDSNECLELLIGEYKFYLINIARIENIGFVSSIINKICQENLWEKCKDCLNCDKCPIIFNKKCISNNKERVITLIEMYYRWLKENDKRITIRQMLSHISYAITGNLECDTINKFDKKQFVIFKYNFANLFFGYRGIVKSEEANQIKSIVLIQELALDDISLEKDYDFFVREDFSIFNEEIREVINEVWKIFSKEIYFNSGLGKEDINKKQSSIRKAIRRFYLLYGENEKSKVSEIFSEIYGDIFTKYIEATSKKLNRRELKKLTRMIYEGLYIKNMGVPPIGTNKLYLTLTRDDNSHQGVLLLLGKAEESDLEIRQVKKNIEIEDIEDSYTLVLSIANEEEFKITLPLLVYFSSIVNGEISTEINPSLSHGLAELNSILLKCFRHKIYDDDSLFSVIINTVSGSREINIEISEDKIYFE